MTGRFLEVRTPEGVKFAWPLAGPVERFLAWIIDTMCVMVVLNVGSQMVSVFKILSPDMAAAVVTIGYFVVQTGYSMALEWWWRGQTIGKRVMKIRVTDAEGLRLQPSQVIIRNLMRAVDSLPLVYAVGGLSAVWTRHAQRLGDIVAGTVVIRHEPATAADVTEAIRLKYNSLRAYPHLAARLRQRTTPEEANLALVALTRRDALDAKARVDLFDDLARHFQAKVEFPPEALDGLASEQYVRGVAQILWTR